MFKLFTVLTICCGIMGCSEITPVDIDKAASEVGLAPEDYKISDDGTSEVYSKVNDKTLSVTIDELSNRLNAESKQAGFGDIPFNNFNIQEGSVNDVFSVKISADIAMAGPIDKNKKIKAINFIMDQNENGNAEMMSMLMMAGLTARSLSPDASKEDTAGELTELVAEAIDKDNEIGGASKIVDNVKYTVTADNITGLWIIFEPA